MIYLLTYVIIYGPPLLGGYLFYQRQKKKQDELHERNLVMLYLVPFIMFTVFSLLWSGLLFGVSYLATQG